MKYVAEDLKLLLKRRIAEQEENLDFFIDSSSDGLWCYIEDIEPICWINQRFCRALGYQDFTEDGTLSLPSFLEYFVPEEQDLLHQNIKSQIKFGNRRSDQIFRLVHTNGGEVWMRFVFLLITEGGDSPTLVLGIGTNITLHKEAFFKTEKDSKYYKALLDAQSIFTVFYDTEGRYAYVNDYFCRSLKRSPEAIVGNSSLSFMQESEHYVAYEVYVFCVENPGQRKKAVFTKIDGEGSKRITQWEFVALFDDHGRYEGLLGFGVDITEARRTQILLNEQYALQKALNESTHHAIFVVNTKGKYASFNSVHKELVFKLNGVHIDVGDDMLHCISNIQERERASAFIQKVFAGESLYETWVIAETPEGKVYYNLIATPVKGDNGRIIGAVVQSYDTTAQHQIQEKLTSQNIELLKREQMLLGIAQASEELLRNTDFEDAMQNSLHILQQSMRVDQAYFFEFYNADGKVYCNHVYECYANGAPPDQRKPDLQHIPIEIYQPIYSVLQEGKVYQACCADLPEGSFRSLMESQGIKAFIFFPIHAQSKEVGFIGFDDCTSERVWNDSEIALIQSFGHSISAAYIRYIGEKERVKTEYLLNQASRLAKVGGWEYDVSSDKFFITENAAAILGVPKLYAPKWEELFKIYPNEPDRVQIRAKFTDILHGKSTMATFETHVVHSSGRLVEIMGIAQGMYERGKCIKVVGAFQNIQQQKQAEKALMESEALFRSIVENANDIIFVCDQALTMHYISPNWQKLLGYSVDDWIGKSTVDLLHPDDLVSIQSELKDLISGAKSQGEVTYRILHENGTWRWHFTRGTLLPGDRDRMPQLLAIARDITEARNAQEALIDSKLKAEQSAKQYKAILDSQAVYVIKTDLQGRYTYANDYFLSRFGFSGTLIGKDALESVIPEDHEKLQAAVASCFETPEVPHEVIVRKPTESGVVKAGKWEFKGVINEQTGLLQEILCVGFDVTNEIASLESANQLLELTKSQNQRLIEYTHITSHNLRAPVARIMGLCHLLATDPANPQYMDMLHTSSHTLDDTIRWMNKLLDIENEGQATTKTEVAIVPILQYNMELFKEELQGAKIVVDVPDTFTMEALPLYIDSILNNLISNAVKYKNQTRTLELKFRSHQRPGYRGFSIEDNGIGIDLERYGDRLFKLKGRLNTTVEGKGIGLFFTKRQVESMGGYITVASQPRNGTTFTVWIPQANSRPMDHA
jgi:PAS domain S-box-containing protein